MVFRVFLLTIISALVLTHCSKSDSTGDAASQLILAAEGGTIQTEEGIMLVIPPGALEVDTEIRLQPVSGNAFDAFGISGVQLEPDGLNFLAEATLRIPLPADWNADEPPAIYYAEGDRTSDFFLTRDAAVVEGTPGNYYGVFGIGHFSAWGLARNCHAGTMKYLNEDFRIAGCTLEQMTLEVREEWGSQFRVDPYDYNGDPEEFSLGDVPLQCFLDVYFRKERSFTVGEVVTDSYLESLRNLIQNEGKRIVLGFNKLWKDDNADGIYEGFAHSAALEMVNGELKLRQSVSVNERVIEKVLDHLNDNLIYYPVDGELTAELLNTYRQSKSGVLLEEAVCGSVNCLFNVPLERRINSYQSIQFYISNYASGENPCTPEASEYNSCYFNLEVSEVIQTTVYFDTGQSSTGQVNGTVFGGTYTGSMDGNTFNGFRDDAPQGTSFNSTISVELDDKREKIISMYVYYNFEGSFTTVRELRVSDIPLDYPPASFLVDGTETCDHINMFSSKTSYEDREVTMNSFGCIYGDEIIEVLLF